MPTVFTQLEREEARVAWVYKDHLGFDTIGIGRLVDKRKGGRLRDTEMDFMLKNDVEEIEAKLDVSLPWWRSLSEPRRAVLIQMAFQLGIAGLLKFVGTIAAIKSTRYVDAAKSMLASLWATQTPARAMRLAEQMRTGIWQ